MPKKKQPEEKKDIGLLAGAVLLFFGLITILITGFSSKTTSAEKKDEKKPNR